MRRKLVGVILALPSLLLWTGTAAATPVGTVIAISGPCTDHGRVLNRSDAVQVGDTIKVLAGGHLRLQMADASVISVAPDSSLTVVRYDVDGAGRYVRLSLAQGLLRVQVAPVGVRSEFVIATAVGTASVRSGSADWFVKAQAESAQVGVLAGNVDLTSAVTGRLVSIPSHWGTRLQAGLDVMPPRRWGKTDFDPVISLTECCLSAQPKTETRTGAETR
jgi:hypothetical protein